MTRSLFVPKRPASFSRQKWAVVSSPVLRQEYSEFSYVVHSSADSGVEKSGNGIELMAEPFF